MPVGGHLVEREKVRRAVTAQRLLAKIDRPPFQLVVAGVFPPAMLVGVVRPGELEAFAGAMNKLGQFRVRRRSRGALGEDMREARAVGEGVFLAQPFYCSGVELIEAGDIRSAAFYVRAIQPLEGEC